MLVLIAHGSRDPNWRASLESLATSVLTGSPTEDVRLAFMQFEGPTLTQVLEDAVAQGVRSFRLLPLFMASAGHVDKDIRPLVAELARRFPGVTMELLGPVGENPLFHTLIQNIANHTLS